MLRLASAVILAVALAATPARGWVIYYRTFGDWVVVCWRDSEEARGALCSLSTPPQTMSTVTEALLHVQEYAPNAFQVAIELRAKPQPDAPVTLRAGTYRGHEAPVAGEFGAWTGAEGARIVAEMLSAERLTFRARLAPSGRPYDTEVSLAGFRDALDAYRAELRVHAILPAAR